MGGYCKGSSGGDCVDDDASISPSTPELCNGRDDNCSGGADEGGVAQADHPAIAEDDVEAHRGDGEDEERSRDLSR